LGRLTEGGPKGSSDSRSRGGEVDNTPLSQARSPITRDERTSDGAFCWTLLGAEAVKMATLFLPLAGSAVVLSKMNFSWFLLSIFLVVCFAAGVLL